MAITYYYPEGPLGPTCDIFTDDDDAAGRRRDEDTGDGRDITYGPLDFPDLERIMDGPVSAILSRRCRVRTLSDGTKEFYDCVDDLLSPIGTPSGYPLIEPQYDWQTASTTPWGLNDNFEPIQLSPIDCSPFDPDINIIPIKAYRANGTFVEKVLQERSSPPTFPVTGGTPLAPAPEIVTATFVEEGGFDANGFSVYNELDGNSDFDGDGFIPSSLNEWHYMDDGGSAQLWNNVGETVEDNYTMTGGNGSGMVLRIELEGIAGSGGNPNNTRLRVKQVISAGTGYRSGDEVNFNFTTPRRTNAGLGAYSLSPTPIRLTSVGSGAIKLRVTGTAGANGNVGLNLRWNDNPNTAGTALGSVTIDGVTLTQSGRRGSQDASVSVTPGTDYPLTITGGTGYGGQTVSSNSICFYDLDGTDCNATLTITLSSPADTEPANNSYWSEEGDKYAVWVNPEVCTLPQLQQTVTYFVDIPATDTYTITGGTDDNFNVYLNDETSAVIGGAGGIFAGGSLTTPYSATRTLTEGQLKIVVNCTNSDAGFQDAEGNPTGLAYTWARNPGGWYIKICRGTSCIGSSTINWVKSGPDPKERWSSFMDNYAVYPSNSDVLIDTDHTATYNVLIPAAGNYTFEYAADNQGTFTFDGSQIATSTNFTSSNTVTLSNVTAGPHTVGVTIRNSGPNTDWTENPGGIAWTISPVSGYGAPSIDWTISGASSGSGYRIRNNGQRIQWDDDAGGSFDVNATMDIGKVTQVMGSNVNVSFSSDGTGLDVTGFGEADVRLDFEWDDKPSISGQAVGTLTIAGATFSQGNSTEGNISRTIRVTAGDLVASSLDLNPVTTEGNLIWHTRMATGYKYVEV